MKNNENFEKKKKIMEILRKKRHFEKKKKKILYKSVFNLKSKIELN